MTKRDSDAFELMLTEMITIKKLMVFQLLNSGVSQKQLAGALGLNQSQISRMFPSGSSNVRVKKD